MKKQIRLFFLSFFATLAVVALICGFLLADENTRSNGYGEFVPMLKTQQIDPLHHRFSVMGETYDLSLEGLNTAAGAIQKWLCFVPVSGRLGLKLLALGQQQLNEYFLF